MQQMRRCLSSVAEREQVLAKWSVDGWYYQGTVVTSSRGVAGILLQVARMGSEVRGDKVIQK